MLESRTSSDKYRVVPYRQRSSFLSLAAKKGLHFKVPRPRKYRPPTFPRYVEQAKTRENNFFFLNCWIRDNNDDNIDSWQAIASFLSEKSKERGIRRWILEEGEKEKRMSWKLRLDGYVESPFRDSSSIDDRSKSRFDAVIAGGCTRFVRNFTLFSVERKWLKIYEREERDALIKFSAQIQFFLKKNPRKT